MDTVVISNCTGRKRATEHGALEPDTEGWIDAGLFAKAWAAELRQAPHRQSVSDMYVGRSVAETAATAQLVNARRFFVSAGLGLVDANDAWPNYNLTISSGDGSIAPFLARSSSSFADWWAALNGAIRGSVSLLPEGHRCRNLHGHGFEASVFAELKPGWAAFPGGEVSSLTRRLEAVLAPLNYGNLNDVIEHPTDENISRWIRKEMNVPGIDRVAVKSTPNQGVDLDRDGIAHVWRRYKFQAAHKLPNVPVGHKCGRMHGHGFEVIVHANQDLGSRPLSIDYDHLDELWAPLHFELNYRCLNEIQGLENPTSELISSWLWQRLKPQLPELSWITVFETGSCGANFDGANYRIWKDLSCLLRG